MSKEIYIFVYGLLKSIYKNHASDFVSKNCEFITNGNVRGYLFDLGNYPGIIVDNASPYQVFGEIYRVTSNADTVTAFLDEFEGVGDKFPLPNEYRREIIEVNTVSGKISAYCYVYNLPWEDFPLIESGVY